MDRKSLVILDAGGGTAIQSPTGGRGKIKVGVVDTAGSLTIYESLRPAGDPGGPLLHQHLFDSFRLYPRWDDPHRPSQRPRRWPHADRLLAGRD